MELNIYSKGMNGTFLGQLTHTQQDVFIHSSRFNLVPLRPHSWTLGRIQLLGTH